MTASLRGLVALAVVALALLVASLVASRDPQRLDDHTVLASLDIARVDTLAWTGSQPLSLVRSGQGWRFATDPTTPVIARSVEDVLSSLRSARWHRRAEPARLGVVRRSLTLSLGAIQHVIELGAPLAGTDQTWIAVDHGDALLVDNWLVALLDPSALAFRDRTPLAAAPNATSITVHGAHELELAGPPWRMRGMLVAPALVDALTNALAKLPLVSIERSVASGPTTTIAIDKMPSVSIGGACPGGGVAVIAGPAKPACTNAASAAEVFTAIDALAGAPTDVIDRRPAGIAFTTITLPDGTVSLGKRPTVTIHGVVHPADPDRIAELVRALAEPGEPTTVAFHNPAFTLVIAPITLDVLPGLAVRRRGEPLALIIAPASRAVLERPASLLVDAERWSEEPTTITTISIDGVIYQRGTVLGEWSRTPASPGLDPTLVDALAEAVSKLHAPARTGTAPTPHRVVVTFVPPIGSTVTHELALGAPTADGCPATIEGDPVTAPLGLCIAVAGLAH